MNFYKRHLGDYAKDAGHLSMLEHGAYTLLLDRYYTAEASIPKADVYRVTRARSKAEKEATDAVLSEFFTLEGDAYVNRRAEEELTTWRAQAETNRRIAANREAKKRARIEHESFNEPSTNRSTVGQPSQNPESRIQEKASSASTQDLQDTPRPATDAGRACLLMRKAGCTTTNPSHPSLLAAMSEGVTPESLGHTVAEGVASGKSNPFAWAIAAARSRHAQGATPITPGGTDHATRSNGSKPSLVERAQQSERDANGRSLGVIEGTARRVG